MPAPTSVPAQLTEKFNVASAAGSGIIWLVGGVLSIVFVQVGVLIGAFASKTTVAWFRTWVFVSSSWLGITVKNVLPLLPGGRNPTVGSVGGWLVVGSRDWKVHVSSPVDISK